MKSVPEPNCRTITDLFDYRVYQEQWQESNKDILQFGAVLLPLRFFEHALCA